MKTNKQMLLLFFIGAAFAGGLFWMVAQPKSQSAAVSYSQFLQQVRNGTVDTVTIEPSNAGSAPATFHNKAGATARTVLPSDYRDAVKAMQEGSVNIDIQESLGVKRILANSIPFLVLVSVWAIMMATLKGGPRRA